MNAPVLTKAAPRAFVPDPTPSEEFWGGVPGMNYALKFAFDPSRLDEHWLKNWKCRRSDVVKAFMPDIPKDSTVLEVGCNCGNQLHLLSSLGYTRLMGLEINPFAAGFATCRGYSVTVGSLAKSPLPDKCADLVFNCAVVSHFDRSQVDDAMREIGRMSREWVFGTEYCGTRDAEDNFCWPEDYKARFAAVNPDFELVKSQFLEPDGQGLAAYLFRRGGK